MTVLMPSIVNAIALSFLVSMLAEEICCQIQPLQHLVK